MGQPVFWFRVRSEMRGKARGRVVAVHDASGAPVASAWIDRTSRAFVVEPGLVVTRRRLFPLTGRVDITSTDGEVIGRTNRSGVVRDASGREVGRFRDARSMRSFFSQGFFEIIFAIITGVETSDAGPSGPTGLVWKVAGVPRGGLRRTPWPFGHDEPATPRRQRSWRARLLPERFRRFLRELSRDPTWVLELDAPEAIDPRLTLGSAIFAIELSQW
jgi:hypothetical protein